MASNIFVSNIQRSESKYSFSVTNIKPASSKRFVWVPFKPQTSEEASVESEGRRLAQKTVDGDDQQSLSYSSKCHANFFNCHIYSYKHKLRARNPSKDRISYFDLGISLDF